MASQELVSVCDVKCVRASDDARLAQVAVALGFTEAVGKSTADAAATEAVS